MSPFDYCNSFTSYLAIPLIYQAISEHVENAGVHSGDATLVLPAQKLYVQTVASLIFIQL